LSCLPLDKGDRQNPDVFHADAELLTEVRAAGEESNEHPQMLSRNPARHIIGHFRDSPPGNHLHWYAQQKLTAK